MKLDEAKKILNDNGYILSESTITKENAAEYLEMAEKGMMDWEDLAKLAIQSIMNEEPVYDDAAREREAEYQREHDFEMIRDAM